MDWTCWSMNWGEISDGSRGMMISIDWFTIVSMEMSFPCWSTNEYETDREKLVSKWFPYEDKGMIID